MAKFNELFIKREKTIYFSALLVFYVPSESGEKVKIKKRKSKLGKKKIQTRKKEYPNWEKKIQKKRISDQGSTKMLKVCEYNNPNVKFGFVSLDLVLSSRLQNYFGQRLCRINKCMGLESCELETLESRRDKPFTQINTNYATRSSIMSIIPEKYR